MAGDPRAASPDDADHADEAARQLLYEVFPIEKFRDAAYLRWFYRESPLGPAFHSTRSEGGHALAHVGGPRQRYHRRGQELPAMIPLNLAVSERARGRGMMVDVNQACIDAALTEYSDGLLVSVPNASSTPGYVRRLGCRLLGPLPVRVLPPIWPARERVESASISAEYLESRVFEDLLASLDFNPGAEWSQQWSPELLRWRLRAPHTHYALHASARLVLISTAVRQGGVPVCVILKGFTRHGTPRARGNAVAAAACRFHGAPAAIYAGYSDVLRLHGVPLPSRLKPAPLNLIVRSLRPGFLDERTFTMQRFEFLDFDAF
ncbi:MAG TPA: hypothetical protein VK524_33225 [Polyangiaceae bacterium]|nr:hypothetical protein [Polyangiaceae bacterium]